MLFKSIHFNFHLPPLPGAGEGVGGWIEGRLRGDFEGVSPPRGQGLGGRRAFLSQIAESDAGYRATFAHGSAGEGPQLHLKRSERGQHGGERHGKLPRDRARGRRQLRQGL